MATLPKCSGHLVLEVTSDAEMVYSCWPAMVEETVCCSMALGMQLCLDHLHSQISLLGTVHFDGVSAAAHLDAGLGDGDGLLLHGLVDGHLVLHVHLVKLVDAADAVVRQHQRARLDAEVVAVGLLRGHGSHTMSAACRQHVKEGKCRLPKFRLETGGSSQTAGQQEDHFDYGLILLSIKCILLLR